VDITKKLSGKLLRITIIAGIIVLLIIYKYFNPRLYFFPKCPVYTLTGYYCPGCGSQRALHALLNFDFIKAISSNILATICIIALVADMVMYLLKIEKYRPKNFLQNNRHIAQIVLYTVIIFTILRNIPFFPFNLLAP